MFQEAVVSTIGVCTLILCLLSNFFILWLFLYPLYVGFYTKNKLADIKERAETYKNFSKKEFILRSSLWITVRIALLFSIPFLLFAVFLSFGDANAVTFVSQKNSFDILHLEFLSFFKPNIYALRSNDIINIQHAIFCANSLFLSMVFLVAVLVVFCLKPWVKLLFVDFEQHAMSDGGVYVEGLGLDVSLILLGLLLLLTVFHFRDFGLWSKEFISEKFILDSLVVSFYPAFVFLNIVVSTTQTCRFTRPLKPKGE
ncbi:MAG: hypothetical protein R3E13_09085 [Alphaproteobacteria bacterium]